MRLQFRTCRIVIQSIIGSVRNQNLAYLPAQQVLQHSVDDVQRQMPNRSLHCRYDHRIGLKHLSNLISAPE